jgi:hypothetical protein
MTTPTLAPGGATAAIAADGSLPALDLDSVLDAVARYTVACEMPAAILQEHLAGMGAVRAKVINRYCDALTYYRLQAARIINGDGKWTPPARVSGAAS